MNNLESDSPPNNVFQQIWLIKIIIELVILIVINSYIIIKDNNNDNNDENNALNKDIKY